MGKLRISTLLLFAFLVVLMAKLSSPAHANGNNCQLQNTFPGNYLYPPSHFGANRSGGARWHAGVDFFYEKGTRVNIPQGCEIRLYSDGTAIWKSDPTGYGNYMFLDCDIGGVPLTLRYSHIAQYVTSEAAIEQGRTGIETASIPDHYHFEVLISQSAGKGTPVDPECVLGLDKNVGGPASPIPECRQCPTPPGPVDFCNNPDAVAQLINHSKLCYKGNDKNNPGGETVDPNRMRSVENQGDPSAGASEYDGSSHEHGHDHTEHSHDYQEPEEGDGFEGDVDSLYPPLDQDPPIQPPPPDIPGTKGGITIDLTPAPENNDNVPEKVSGCAADTWTAMVNQAVLQTRRQDLVNKRFIVKPDSVLDYSCFANKQNLIATQAAPIFSETMLWDNQIVDVLDPDEGRGGRSGQGAKDPFTIIRLKELDDGPPFNSETGFLFEQIYVQSNGVEVTFKKFEPQSLDMAIDSLVTTTTFPYLENNFMHGFLADTATVSGASVGTCNVMNQVWQASKCQNADGSGLFYTFEDLMSQDPREFPLSMPCF